MAAKRLTPTEVAERLAGETGLTVEQVKAVLKAQAKLAYAEATEGFPIPGIGIFSNVSSDAREMIMRFGPMAGKRVAVQAKQRLKFRVSRLAKDMVLDPTRSVPDLFKPVQASQFKFSTDAPKLSDPSMFISDLANTFTLVGDGEPAAMVYYRLPDLELPSGRIVAADGLIGGSEPFSRTVPPGSYPLALAVARLGDEERVALAIIRFSNGRAVKWEMAISEGVAASDDGQSAGFGVDTGKGSVGDATAQQLIAYARDEDDQFNDELLERMKAAYKHARNWIHIDTPNGSSAVFSSGYGDGFYTSYFGIDDTGNAVSLVTDFKLIKWRPVPTV
jgi:hypothetical protein